MSDIKSSLSHALLAFNAQAFVALVLYAFGVDLPQALAIGAIFPIGFYFGREVAQAERKAGTPPWWSGFNPSNWSKDNALDFAFPAVTVLTIAGVTLCF